MALQLYNPFENLYFDDKTCFLTGKELQDGNEAITVFPTWVLEEYKYKYAHFKMMDTVTSIPYKDLKLPCSKQVKEAYEKLDEEVYATFKNGCESVAALDELKLFQWMGRIVFGVLYHDLLLEKKKNENFEISSRLKERFSYFHLMLQSLIAPVFLGELKPWSIAVVGLKYSKDIFNYRDDTINLMFTLGMNGFGIVACLQDNGVIKKHYETLLNKIGKNILHPVQFEELSAKFIYSKYLLQYKPRYQFKTTETSLHVEALPVEETDTSKTLFKAWDNKTYASLLAEYWKPWGLTSKDIVRFASDPATYLENERTYEFIDPESIELPF